MIAVLVFDSVSVSILERMLASGRLSGLASLQERGVRLELSTPARDFAAGAFYSLYSGIELADHGIFYPFQWDPATQRAHYTTAFPAPPAIWERLAGRGLRTLAIDPYECRPPQQIDGLAISGVGFRERVVLPAWSRPRGARPSLTMRQGRAPTATEVFGRPRPAQLARLQRRLLAAPGRVADAALRHLRRDSFDLVWLTFSASHMAGHQFWDLSQLDAEALDPSRRATLESALEDIYAAVDAAISRVLAALPEDCDVIVTSAVGMDVNSSRADLLPGMLEAVLRGGPAPAGADEAGAVWKLRGAVPAGVRSSVAAALPRRVALELTSRLELSGLDWSTTRAFAHPADNQGYLRLNLSGRERDGIVDPGDAEGLMEEIEQGLREFEDLDGGPAVAAIERTAARYSGDAAERLPDMVVHWSESPATALAGVRSARHGEVRRRGAGSGRSGNHTPGDSWALLAPGASRLAGGASQPSLIDVAATVAHLLSGESLGLPGTPLLDPNGSHEARGANSASLAIPATINS